MLSSKLECSQNKQATVKIPAAGMPATTNPIPKQLQPIPFFASLEEQAGELLTYSRNFLHLVYKNQLTSEIEIWISQYEPRTEGSIPVWN